MRVIGFMVCGPGEADRYLEGSLKEFARLCDDAMIVCNNTTKKEEELIESYGFSWYRDDREWGLHQPDIKTDLLARIGQEMNPDWILPLDADEQYGTIFTREELERLASTNALAFYFYIVNLWNDEEHYRRNISFWNIRAYKYEPARGLRFLKRNVHCGLAPPFAYRYGRYAPHLVRHYGLMAGSDRAKKVERYAKYDKNADKVGIGGWYEALASKDAGSTYVESEVQAKVSEEFKRMNQNLNKEFSMGKYADENVYVYLTHKVSGRTFEVPKSKVRHYKNCEIVGEVEVPMVKPLEAPVIKKREEIKKEANALRKPPGGGMTCEECDFATLSKGGLTRHINAKHKEDNKE